MPKAAKKAKRAVKKSAPLKQYVIELGVMFHDGWKTNAMAGEIKRAARELYVRALMLSHGDDGKPRIAVFSDDFFTGHEELSLTDVERGVTMVDEFNQASKKVKKAVAKGLPPKKAKKGAR